jgi:ATP phosphoribosyltransferase
LANRSSWKDPWKRNKIENMSMLLQGAITAEEKVGVKMNVPKKKLDAILKLLPSLQSPTVSEQKDMKWVSVEVMVDEKIVRDIIPVLKRAGATGIVEYPLNKVIF